MSNGLYAQAGGQVIADDQLTRPIKTRLQQARKQRKTMEPTWHSSLAFASGKFWLEWDRFERALRMPAKLRGEELYTADVITEYRMHVLGELNSGDDRPELLTRTDDQSAEDFQEQLNKALSYGWDHEFKADTALREARRLCIDLGTSAVRCRFDPTVGPPAGTVPHLNGQPVFGEQAAALFQDGPNPAVEMRDVREGRIRWEPLSPFNLLVPPGIPHEDMFPWECIVRPVLLVDVKAQYGAAAADLKEDGDIGSLLGYSSDDGGRTVVAAGEAAGRVRDHVWLFEWMERPTPTYPDGRVLTFGGNTMKLLDVKNELPYVAPDGTRRSGIAYFHWWRVSGRFFSRGLVDVMKDIQRGVNKRRTQINAIIDRGLPFVMVEENSKATQRKGYAVELIELGPQERVPVLSQGIAPGAWMEQNIEAMRGDLDHATGIRVGTLGENPPSVDTYSSLARLLEQDAVKREPIIAEHRQSIARLVEDSVYDIRRYWGDRKQLMLAGDDDSLDVSIFNATKIPPYFLVRTPAGAVKPRSQAAELQKVADIMRVATETMAAAQSPDMWVRWFKESLDAGQPLELPSVGGQVDPTEKAQLENEWIAQGQQMPIAYYDPHPLHLAIHRNRQDEALLSGDMQTWQAIDQHCQLHVNAATAAARAAMDQQAHQQQVQQAQQQAAKPAATSSSKGT